MSVLKSKYSDRIISVTAGSVDVDVSVDSVPSVGVDRADFLAAVESELNVRLVPADAIVIERSELPEVTVDSRDGGLVTGKQWHLSRLGAADRRATALQYLALAEYLTANPPVDEAQVTALNAVILSAFPDGVPTGDGEIARRLVARGVRVEGVTS